jgi:hypothetical protein
VTPAPRGKERHGADNTSCSRDVRTNGDVRGTLTNTWRKDGHSERASARVRKEKASILKRWKASPFEAAKEVRAASKESVGGEEADRAVQQLVPGKTSAPKSRQVTLITLCIRPKSVMAVSSEGRILREGIVAEWLKTPGRSEKE